MKGNTVDVVIVLTHSSSVPPDKMHKFDEYQIKFE